MLGSRKPIRTSSANTKDYADVSIKQVEINQIFPAVDDAGECGAGWCKATVALRYLLLQ